MKNDARRIKRQVACGVMVIVVGNGHSDSCSNLVEAVCISYSTLYPLERYESNYCPSRYGEIVVQTVFFSLGMAAGLGEIKVRIQTSF